MANERGTRTHDDSVSVYTFEIGNAKPEAFAGSGARDGDYSLGVAPLAPNTEY